MGWDGMDRSMYVGKSPSAVPPPFLAAHIVGWTEYAFLDTQNILERERRCNLQASVSSAREHFQKFVTSTEQKQKRVQQLDARCLHYLYRRRQGVHRPTWLPTRGSTARAPEITTLSTTKLHCSRFERRDKRWGFAPNVSGFFFNKL